MLARLRRRTAGPALSSAVRTLLRTAQTTQPLAAIGQPLASATQCVPLFRGVLVDAAGTLLIPSEPISDVYLRYARGCTLSPADVLQRFRTAYNTPWGVSPLRYVGDARPFWRHIVEQSTGCTELQVSEDIYDYYTRAEAWRLAPGAAEALQRLKSAGVLLAVVSNFDTRLRPLLRQMGMEALFDAIIVSAEVGAEKPNPEIFHEAVRALNAGLGYGPLQPEQVLHVGDDRRNDIWGARDAGLTAWMYGYDVRDWRELADMVLRIQADDS